MNKVIGEIHYKRYDDGALELEAGGYPSLEQACYDLGDLLEPQIIKLAGEGEENFPARRNLACDMVRAFVDGLKGNMAEVLWKNPKKELPENCSREILFALDIDDPFNLHIKRGYYRPADKLFYVSHRTSTEHYKVDQVACWMPMPHPIKFDEDKGED